MHARLKDGKIIELVKDCDCLPKFHDGAHWLYADALWKERNRALLQAGNFHGFLVEDRARLREKIFQMGSRSIEELILTPAPVLSGPPPSVRLEPGPDGGS